MTVVTATAPALWRAEKSVLIDGHSTHRHKPSPVSDGFKPPSMPRELRIRPEVLAAAMARTLTLRTAPDVMLAYWTRSQFAEIEYLITNGPQFQLSPFITALADAERSGFAGRVGAGMCDLVMNVLGYVWRDNASCLSGKAAKHADFIYVGGAATGHGVVLTEAHGSFAQSVTKTTISGEARRKYRRQVKPHVATSCPYGNVVHGYSIAFGCNPARHDTHLHVAETEVTMPRGKVGLRRSPGGQPGAGQVPTSIALATYRSNFLLMGAWRVVAWIDWLLGRGVRPEVDLATTFYAFELSGETKRRDLQASLATRCQHGEIADPSALEYVVDHRALLLCEIFEIHKIRVHLAHLLYKTVNRIESMEMLQGFCCVKPGTIHPKVLNLHVLHHLDEAGRVVIVRVRQDHVIDEEVRAVISSDVFDDLRTRLGVCSIHDVDEYTAAGGAILKADGVSVAVANGQEVDLVHLAFAPF